VNEDLDATRVMRIVDHPVRMKIIELLATRGPMSWKELSLELGTGTGTLYHHLDTLEKIVTRDSSKKYVLTPMGEQVHAQLRSVPTQSPDLRTGRNVGHGSDGILSNIIAPRSLLRFMTATAPRSLVSLLVISGVVVGIALYSKIELILFAFGPSPNLIVTAAGYVASLLLVSAISYASSSLLFKQKPELLTLVSSSSLSFLPMAGLSLLLKYLVNQHALGILADRTVLTAFVALFQALSVVVLSSGTSVASGLRIEKTLIVGLILLYISMSVLFIQGRIL
jgi:hypothetical protein